jgi:serine/threonine-protein kinase
MLRRFRAEAVTSARLRHKNIVTIFDFEEQDGAPYLVMEYLDGENLQRLLETKERVPILDKLSIMAEVAEGLQYAHEHGVIHRDIKPANIMRLRDGSVKIMDFGIARLTQRNTRLTAVGYIVGTPEYMAPEQFMSDGTDSQCDVWSYGVVLYEFLTGHNPFAADSPGAIIYRVTHEDPPAICDRLAELPPSLDPVLRRLLAKKKTERYPSMEDLLLDLGPVIQEFGESQVGGMEKSAEALIRAGKYDEALAVAARILKFDQKNTRARKWRADLRDLSRRQKEEARIKVLIEEADQKTTLLDFSAAEARLKEALQIDPSNSTARTRLDQLNAVREKKVRAQNLLAEARVEFGHQNLTSAFEHATEAAQSDPASAEATEFARQVRKALDKRDSEARRKAGLSKSRGMLLVQDYAGAVNTLQELAKQYPGDSEVRARLDEALHLQAVDATEKKAAAAIAKSRDYLVKGAFQDAIDLLSSLDPEAGRNVQVLQLLSYARDQREQQKREAEVERLLATATASQGDYDRALASVDRALELSPGNEKALRLRKTVLANRQRDEENRAIEGELKECRSLMSADRLEHAETRARALWKRHSDHPGVQQIIRDLGERFRQREEAIEREIESRKAELERLLDQGDAESAAALLKTLSARYQRDNLFADLSRRIGRMESEKREQDAVNGIVARSQRLGDGGYWDDARLAIDLGLKQFPKSGALLAQRERILQQAELQTVVNDIQRKIAREEWDSVVNSAESGLRKFPGDPRLTELLRTARGEREWKELLLRTESLILAGDLQEADQTIAELARRGRDNAAVVRLLRMLGDKRQRQQSLASADQFRKRFAFQQAHDVLETILKEDRNDTAARALLEAVDREQSAYTRGQKVAAARTEAGRLTKLKEYAAAVRILTEISNAYPGDFEVEEDLRHAIEALDQAALREAYARGRNELAALVRNRQFDQALQKAEELIADFPDDSELRDELRRVREARDQAARKQAYEEGRREVAALMKSREFDRAIARLQELAAAFPEEPEVGDELRRARATREHAARKEEYARNRKEIEALMTHRKFEEAVARARQLVETFPEEPELHEIVRRAAEARDRAARKEAYARGRKEFEELVRKCHFDQAVSAVERLSIAFPEEPELQEDLRRARAARNQAQRKNAYTRRREGFDALMADRQFDLAVNAAEGLIRDFPEEPELQELLRHAREARDRAGRKDAYSRGCRDFEALMRDGKFEQAVTAAERLIAAYPEEKEPPELLSRARKAREEAERKAAYARGCQDFEALMRDRKFEQAVTDAERLIAAYPEEKEPPELLSRARKAREEAERKEAYARGCQDFEALMRDRKFEQAVTAAERLIAAYPEEKEPPELLSRARKAREEAERKAAYSRDRQDFEALMRDRKFEQAITAAQQLMTAFPEDPDVPELLRDAQAARELAGRKDAYSRSRQDFEVLMRDRKFEQAVTAAQQLIAAFPEEQESAELLRRSERAREEAARTEAYARGRQGFEALMGEGKFEQAVTAAQGLVAAFPKESEPPKLLRRAEKAREEAARKEAYTRDRQAFDVPMRDGKFEQAVTAAKALIAAFPKEPEPKDLLRRAQDARDEAVRKEAYTRGRQAFDVLMRDGKFDEAVTASEQLVSTFPKEPEVTVLLHRAREARQEAYSRGRQAFDVLMRDGKFEQAITAAQQLVVAFPNEPEAAELWQRAQSAHGEAARQEAYKRDRQTFDVLMREGKFEQAITAAQQLVVAFPNEPEAAELWQRAQSARDEAARREAYKRDRQTFDVLMREGKFEQAVTAAEHLIAAYPEEPELPELLRRAEGARDEAARREAYKRDRQTFDVLMRDGKFEQAVTAAERLVEAYPEESELPDLLRRARDGRDEAARKEAYRRDRQAFDVLMRDGKFDQAVTAAERLTATYPEEPELPEVSRRARQARDEAARKAAYASGLQDFEALLANAQFDQAIAKAQELNADFPAEPGAAKALERARAAQAEGAHKAAFGRGHKEFDALMRQRQFDRAIAKAQELATVFPEEAILKDDLKRAGEAREQARRQQIYEPGRKEFDALMKSGRIEEAIEKAEALAKEFPEDAVVQQDLQSARAAFDARQREAELDRQAADAVRRASQLRQQRAITEALELVQKTIQEVGNRAGLRELQEQLLADQARTRLARQTLDKARDAVAQGQVEAAEQLASELETNLSGAVDTRDLRVAIAAKAEELRVRAAIEAIAREAEDLRSQGRFDEALQSLDTGLQQYPGTQVLIVARERVEKDRQAALRKQAREQALSEISALPQSVQSAPDDSGLRAMVLRAEAIAAGYPGDKQFKQAAQAVNKAAKRRRTEFAQVPGATTAPAEAAPLWKHPIAVAAIAAGLAIGGAAIWWLVGGRAVTLQVSTNPAGARVTVGSMSCTAPQCALRLPPGNYEIRAEKPGYRASSTTATVGKSAPAPVALTLVPLPARLSVGANFTKATISFDGTQLGQLRNGEFALDSVPEGAHKLDIHSSDGQATLRFEYTAGQPPKILAPPSGIQIQAVVVSGYASAAEVQCDCASGEVTLDGKSAGQLQDHRLALTSLSSGTHQLRVSAPDGIRESVVSLQDSPSINLYVAADLDVGTLVVEAGQDGVQVLLDNRPQPALTHDGIARIPVPSKLYSVSVAKQGFRAPTAKSVEVKRGQLQRVSFELVPLESVLEIRVGSPGIRVQIDGQSAGVTGADGSLRLDNVKPGTHTIDLTKDGYTPLHLNNFKFEPGATVSLGREVQLAALPTPTQPNPSTVTPTPTPDPRAVEADEWNRIQNTRDINQLQEFIHKYPGDAYGTQAAARVEQMEWDGLQNSQDSAAWEAFANRYPKSDRADQTRKRAEQLAWSRVDQQNAAQIRVFLQHHAGNPDAAAALAAAEQTEHSAADKRAISQVLTQYQQAFTNKNIDGLLALRPSLKGTPTEKVIREAFRQKQSIVLELTPLRDADVSADSAVIQCRQSTQNQQGVSQPDAADVTVTITLSRSGQSWIVKDIRPVSPQKH